MRAKHIIFVAPFETLLASKLGRLHHGYVSPTERQSPYLVQNRVAFATNQKSLAD